MATVIDIIIILYNIILYKYNIIDNQATRINELER